MTTTENLSEIRAMLQEFQDGYTARDVTQLDETSCNYSHQTMRLK